MKKPLTATFILLFAALICPKVTWGEPPVAAAQSIQFHPAVTALFETEDPFAREVVLPNIEAN